MQQFLLSRENNRKRGVTSRATTPLGRGATLNSGGSVLPYMAGESLPSACDVVIGFDADAHMMPHICLRACLLGQSLDRHTGFAPTGRPQGWTYCVPPVVIAPQYAEKPAQIT